MPPNPFPQSANGRPTGCGIWPIPFSDTPSVKAVER
jgi:hypothetical protein